MDHQLPPHGGTLCDLMLGAQQAVQVRAESVDSPSIVLTDVQICVLELLMNGAFSLGPDGGCHIPKGAKHRIANLGEGLLRFIEVQYGSYLGEDDIERFEDIYGRR